MGSKQRKESPESQLINGLIYLLFMIVKTVWDILCLAWKASQVTVGRKKLFVRATVLFFVLLMVRGLLYSLFTTSIYEGNRLSNQDAIFFDMAICLYLLLFAPYLAFRTVAAIPRIRPGLKYATVWMDRSVFVGLCIAYLLWPFAFAFKVPPQERKLHKTVQSYTYSRAGYYVYQAATPLGVKYFSVEGPRGTLTRS